MVLLQERTLRLPYKPHDKDTALKTLTALLIGASLVLTTGQAFAAMPDPDSRDGELVCAGLTAFGFMGAQRSQPPVPQAVAAMTMAYGFRLGRLSQLQPPATKAEVDAAVGKLSLEEKNIAINACMKATAQKMAPLVN